MFEPSRQAISPSRRLNRHGPAALTDAELTALILGDRISPSAALALADTLVGGFGGLGSLALAPVNALTQHQGIGPARAARVAAAFELGRRALCTLPGQRPRIACERDAAALISRALAGQQREVFVGLFLDSGNRLIAAEQLFAGTLNVAPVYPREVVMRALALGAASVIIGHNHPSGRLEPSAADRRITATLEQALALVEVALHDHVIVSGEASVSLRETGWP